MPAYSKIPNDASTQKPNVKIAFKLTEWSAKLPEIFRNVWGKFAP